MNDQQRRQAPEIKESDLVSLTKVEPDLAEAPGYTKKFWYAHTKLGLAAQGLPIYESYDFHLNETHFQERIEQLSALGVEPDVTRTAQAIAAAPEHWILNDGAPRRRTVLAYERPIVSGPRLVAG